MNIQTVLFAVEVLVYICIALYFFCMHFYG